MSCSVSTLVDNLSDIKCENCDNKREYIGFRDNYMFKNVLIALHGLKKINK